MLLLPCLSTATQPLIVSSRKMSTFSSLQQISPVSALMSPPDAKLSDRFEVTECHDRDEPLSPSLVRRDRDNGHDRAKLQKPSAIAAEPPSPPASPWATHQRKSMDFGTVASIEPRDTHSQDPTLYPAIDGATQQQSLFPDESEPISSLARDNAYHFVRPKSRRDGRKRRYQCPTDEEFHQTLTLRFNLHKSFNANPGSYLYKEYKEALQTLGSKRPRMTQVHEMHVKEPKVSVVVSRRSAPQTERTQTRKRPLPDRNSDHKAAPSRTAAERVRVAHTRAPSIKRPEDVDFESLADYSPPTLTLPNNNKALKIEWSSHNPLDLSNDPHRHLLHEAELSLASTLRLNCATYLCSKRRIFLKVRDAYQIGKEFRKTDAQQACQIDVNKASKLWIAYDRVGWFKRDHFASYLN